MAKRKVLEYAYKDEIENVKQFLENIGDERTVIVGPDYGDSNANHPNSRLRVYSYGANAIGLSTDSGQMVSLNQKHKTFFPETDRKSITYSELDEDMLKNVALEAKKRAEGMKDGDSKTAKEYYERSVETRLVVKNRSSKFKNAIIIDMEFSAPTPWYETIVKHSGKSTTGKPDMIVLDLTDCSFGLIELKYKNKSTANMDKHFADFYNIMNGKHAMKFKEEFCRRTKYLMEYGLIDKIPDEVLEKAKQNDMWDAFLFVEGDSVKSKELFDSAEVDTDYIDKDTVGYLYVEKLDDEKAEVDIDYSKENFFKYLKKNAK